MILGEVEDVTSEFVLMISVGSLFFDKENILIPK
jgi:hypothetical protein